MARYKDTGKGQGLFLTVKLSEQLIEGTFEYTLKHLIDEKLNLNVFDDKYKNDLTGAPAIDPRILLKIILYCYSLGALSSRKIAKLCETHMIVKALAEDIEPHYTTISDFVSEMGERVEKIFTEVLFVCHEMKLIGGKMFAIDGCKLPSNSSKEWSGTKEELQERYEKIKKICKKIHEKHRSNDKLGITEIAKDRKKLNKLKKKAAKILDFLSNNEDRKGASGEIIKSNITDNESGKLKSSDGVIQGYSGIAVADSKNQVIIAATAHGTVAEGQFFSEMLEKTENNMKPLKEEEEPLKGSIILGDNAFFSEDNLQKEKKKEVEPIIPDEQFRNRDEELKDGKRREGKEKLDARHFKYDNQNNCFICLNGKKLEFKSKVKLNRTEGNKYQSKASDCIGCPYADKCLHSKKKEKKYRTLFIPITKYEENLCQKMRENIDKPKYKNLYSQRLGIIEPVFANITYCKGMDRFTLRGQGKVNVQWQLYCIVHNISKCNMAEKRKLAG
jgi:transposase